MAFSCVPLVVPLVFTRHNFEPVSGGHNEKSDLSVISQFFQNSGDVTETAKRLRIIKEAPSSTPFLPCVQYLWTGCTGTDPSPHNSGYPPVSVSPPLPHRHSFIDHRRYAVLAAESVFK